MPAIPPISLSQGQLAWTLNLGREPSKRLLDQLRYLRLKGVPYAEKDKSPGRGNPLRYGFDELIECGAALFALNRGIKPGDAAQYLVKHRKDLREIARIVYTKQPDNILNSDWALSRGSKVSFGGYDGTIHFRGRFSGTPGKIEIRHFPKGLDAPAAEEVEVYPDGSETPVLNLRKLTVELVAWALQAPEIRAGRKA